MSGAMQSTEDPAWYLEESSHSCKASAWGTGCCKYLSVPSKRVTPNSRSEKLPGFMALHTIVQGLRLLGFFLIVRYREFLLSNRGKVGLEILGEKLYVPVPIGLLY